MRVEVVKERLPPLDSPEYNRLPPRGKQAVNREHNRRLADGIDTRNAARVAAREKDMSELVEDTAHFVSGEAGHEDAVSRFTPEDMMYSYAKQVGDGVCESMGINKATLRQLARGRGRTR